MSAIGTGGSVQNAIDTGGNVYAEDWSQYPAVQNVNMAGYTIVNTTIDVSDQNINVRDISAKDISANNVYVNSVLDTNGNLFVAQDISCGGTIRTGGLQVIDNAIFDPCGTGLYGFQRGIAQGGTYNPSGTSNQQRWNNQVGIFGNSLSGQNVFANQTGNGGQGQTNLQIFDTWLSGGGWTNAGGVGFGARNYGFGKQNVMYAKIGGQTSGNFQGGLIEQTHSNGLLRPTKHTDYLRRTYIHGLTTLSGGVNTPIYVYSNETGTTAHGSHLNLHDTSYAVGTQAEGTYIRSYSNFNVYHRGTHATSGAGGGGFTMMTLDLSGPSFASNAFIGGGTVLRERNQPITDISDVTVDLKDYTSEAAFTRSCIQLSGGHLNVRMATSDLCAGADWDTVEFYVGNAGAAPRNVNFNCYSNDSQVSADGRILDFWNPPGVNTGFISYGSSVSGPEVAANGQAIIKVKKCKANTFGANSLWTQFMVTSV